MVNSRASRPIIFVAVLLAFLLVLGLRPYAPSREQITDRISLPGLSIKEPSIPNIVHYVMLKKEPDSELHLRFSHFLSIYASLIYFSPTTIYLHTDHNASAIAEASVSGSKWTRIILNLPKVQTNEVVSPVRTAGTDKLIKLTEHKSDFVRIDELVRTGGIYMDLDVLPLRDIKPLRKAGYKSIVGRELNGGINNGIIMAQKGAALTRLMQRDGPVAFDGSWTGHSVQLLTPIAERLARFPGEVLIMDEKAFSSFSWKRYSVDALFSQHNDTSLSGEAGPQGLGDEEVDPIAWWDKRTETRRKWEVDFSQGYLLHAFKARGSNPGTGVITVKNIQKRNSNFALAAWPVVRHALESGVVQDGDDEP